VLGDDIALIDSAAETALEARNLLSERGLLGPGAAQPQHRFIASDAPQQFLEIGQRFLGIAINRVETVVPG
jgi:glutamate racemase